MSIFLCVCIIFLLAPYFCSASPGPGDIPASPYDRHIIVHTLIFFWIGIIGLIIIITLKIKEAKRIQDMDAHKDDEDVPFLD